jgi:hypothetical protein
MESTVKLGRPKKVLDGVEVATETSEVKTTKKSNKSWSPFRSGLVLNQDPHFSYKKVADRNESISKHIHEGWEFVKALDGDKAYVGKEGTRIFDGQRLDGVQGGPDWVLMKLPKEMVKQRNAYYNDISTRRMQSLIGDANKSGANITHGSLEIKRGGIKQIIEE